VHEWETGKDDSVSHIEHLIGVYSCAAPFPVTASFTVLDHATPICMEMPAREPECQHGSPPAMIVLIHPISRRVTPDAVFYNPLTLYILNELSSPATARSWLPSASPSFRTGLHASCNTAFGRQSLSHVSISHHRDFQQD